MGLINEYLKKGNNQIMKKDKVMIEDIKIGPLTHDVMIDELIINLYPAYPKFIHNGKVNPRVWPVIRHWNTEDECFDDYGDRMLAAMRTGKVKFNPIEITDDNVIQDGHHRVLMTYLVYGNVPIKCVKSTKLRRFARALLLTIFGTITFFIYMLVFIIDTLFPKFRPWSKEYIYKKIIYYRKLNKK